MPVRQTLVNHLLAQCMKKRLIVQDIVKFISNFVSDKETIRLSMERQTTDRIHLLVFGGKTDGIIDNGHSFANKQSLRRPLHIYSWNWF